MKRLVIAAALVAAGYVPGAKAQTNGWSAAISVTQTAVKVKINNISVTTLPDGKAAVAIAWAWLDAQGRPVRTGVTRYTQAEIDAKLKSKGLSVEALRTLFLSIAKDEAVAP
jgi:hypothetical protein